MQPGIPQVHAAIPVAPISANGLTTQMQMPISAPMVAAGAGAVAGAPPAPGTGGAAGAPVIPSQMVSMNYPTTFDYSAYLDPRDDAEPVRPRRSRRSQRHHRSHHRSRRRSPTPSTGSDASETEYSSPGSYDSGDYHRHHRSNSGHNPLPRPPKDVLASTPFRPILTQLPSAQYNPWGLGGTSNLVPQQQQQPQPQPQPTTYGNVRPRRENRERRGILSRGGRGQFPVVPSLAAAANAFVRPFTGQTMSMPEAHPAQPPSGRTSYPPGTPGPPVIPHMHSPQPPMRMPSPDQGPPMNQGPPVIPQGPGMGMGMPSPGPAGHTPFVGPVGPGGLGTPRSTPMPTPGPSMPVAVVPSPMSGHVPMPTPMNGGGANMPMPSPAMQPGGLAQPPSGNMMVTGAMAMPSPSLGAGMVPQAPQILKFNGYGEFAGLLYHSPHTVLYQDELYPTALHLFEARKFLDHRPDLADRIKDCERVEDVTSISAEMAEFTRRDWSNVALITVSKNSIIVISLLFDWDGALDGRGVVPQVPPARRSAHIAPQHVPRRARLRRVGRPLLGRRRRFGHERARQVAHARARAVTGRGQHVSDVSD